MYVLDDVEAAFSLVNNLDPQSTQDFLLKAITFAVMGYEENSVSQLRAFATSSMEFRLST